MELNDQPTNMHSVMIVSVVMSPCQSQWQNLSQWRHNPKLVYRWRNLSERSFYFVFLSLHLNIDQMNFAVSLTLFLEQFRQLNES